MWRTWNSRCCWACRRQGTDVVARRDLCAFYQSCAHSLVCIYICTSMRISEVTKRYTNVVEVRLWWISEEMKRYTNETKRYTNVVYVRYDRQKRRNDPQTRRNDTRVCCVRPLRSSADTKRCTNETKRHVSVLCTSVTIVRRHETIHKRDKTTRECCVRPLRSSADTKRCTNETKRHASVVYVRDDCQKTQNDTQTRWNDTWMSCTSVMNVSGTVCVCLCCEGLADEVRADFNVMKDLAVHTRIGPGDRVKRLQKFIGDITRFVSMTCWQTQTGWSRQRPICGWPRPSYSLWCGDMFSCVCLTDLSDLNF